MNRIQITRPIAWRRQAFILIVLCALIAIGWYLGSTTANRASSPPTPTDLAQTSVHLVQNSALPSRPEAPPAASAPPLDNYPPIQRKPSALSDQEWQTLKAQASQTANPDHELSRTADYISFQKKYMAWRALTPGAQDPQRQELAQSLLDDLPTKVAQGVVAAQQARQIQEDILTASVPDESRRQQLLEAEHQRLPAQPQAAAPFQH